MTEAEKAKRYDELIESLWAGAKCDNMLTAAMCAAIIRNHRIEGPNGEDPSEA